MSRIRFGGKVARAAMVSSIGVLLSASALAAGLPDASTLLKDLGASPAEIASVEKGDFVDLKLEASTERELVAAFAFVVKTSPKELVAQLRAGLVDTEDSNITAFSMLSGDPTLAQFSKLTLAPDAKKQAKAYTKAEPDGDLNLSTAEIATFRALGSAAGPPAVEQAVRSALLARLEAYRAKGLAGIAPYARGGGKERSAADELRSATKASTRLESLVPNAYAFLLDYPKAPPTGVEEAYRWGQFIAHGTPTIALTHSLFMPDGDAWVVVQRQFYVSTGYNCEQALGAVLPMKSGGTLVVYANRTSTDQVMGFGGGTKRSIGSKLLRSQLQDLYAKIQAKEAK